MTVIKYLNSDYFKVSDTAESVFAGEFVLDESIQVKQMICHMYKHGALSGNESLVAKVYSDSAMTKLIFQSSSYLLSTANMTTYWRGLVPIEFATERFLEAGKSYYIAFELSNYTRNADDFYISFLVDTADPIYTVVSGTPLYCGIVGYKKIASEQ